MVLLSFVITSHSYAKEVKISVKDAKKAYLAQQVLNTEMAILEQMIEQCSKHDRQLGNAIAKQYRSWKRKEYKLFQQMDKFNKVWLDILQQEQLSSAQRNKMANKEKLHRDKQLAKHGKKFDDATLWQRSKICDAIDRGFAQWPENLKKQRGDLYDHLLALKL